MKIFFVLLFCFLSVGRADVDLQSDLTRLEREHKKGTLSPKDRKRLAEIYFLTSRCSDIRKSFPEQTALCCACGGKCEPRSDFGKIQSFRKLLANGASWESKKVQKLWKSVSTYPEARYWALKSLRGQKLKSAKSRKLRFELESALEALNVPKS